jgi:outer membrane protein assembly factor BamB
MILMLIALFSCVFFWLVLTLLAIFPAIIPISPIEQSATRQTNIMTNTLALAESSFWSIDGVIEDLIITDENLIILGIGGASGMNFVILDPETEDFFWKDVFWLRSLAVDAKHLYIGRIYDVLAYDLRTGEEIWRYEQPSKGRGSMYVALKGNHLEVQDEGIGSPFISNTLTLDTQTGEVLKVIPNPGTRPPRKKLYLHTITTNAEYKFIKMDGKLIGINETSQETGYLEMSSPSNGDKVAASEEFLVVYNNNNQELIIFKRTDTSSP